MIMSEKIDEPRQKAHIVTPLITPFLVGKYYQPVVIGTRNDRPLPIPCPTPNNIINATADVTRLDEKKHASEIIVPKAAVL